MKSAPAFPASDLNPDQRLAAHTLDRPVTLTAGPGAGKTKVLVERYLHILRTQPVDVDQLVALTFTNRAAAEMRERVRKSLDELLRSCPSQERGRWMKHKRSLDGAIITTIHGFCARLLREFPVEAAIDPQFALLEEHQSSLLLEAAAEASLTESINANDESITKLTAGVGRSKMISALMGIYRGIRNLGLEIGEVERRTLATYRGLDAYREALSELDLRMREFLAVRDLSKPAESKRKSAERKWALLRPILSGDPGTVSRSAYSQAVQDFREARPNRQRNLRDLLVKLDDLIWEKDLKGRVPMLFFDLRAARYATDVLRIIGRIDTRLSEAKQRISALDFDDLQIEALRLVRTHPEVLRRTAGHYRFFLVDEFQDTNGLQRDLLERLAAATGKRANIFIVGDRKQSIYGFRGADVDVFREMSGALEAQGGLTCSLKDNFRSQPALLDFFNALFSRIFVPPEDLPIDELNLLGYVEHESILPRRAAEHAPPLVEFLIATGSPAHPDGRDELLGPKTEDVEAEQLALRIRDLVHPGAGEIVETVDSVTGTRRPLKFGDIAFLFRALTKIRIYESALRRARVPFLTTQGKGFYQRDEVRDLLQLLRFLDNRTDELALAAVLRSPLCGISDNALLALRRAPAIVQDRGGKTIRLRGGVRDLFHAVLNHHRIDHIHEAERAALEEAGALLTGLVRRRNRHGIASLLRSAVDAASYRTIIAASFDGAQRLANVDKLVALADRFERAGPHMIRDFVRFVRDFEKAKGRESEGSLEAADNAIRLMTIHQSKGLEFPVVVIPELHRKLNLHRGWYTLDRHLGLSLQTPDERGGLLWGFTFNRLRERAQWRERFESMRLLYVASTRTRDRLILSAATDDLRKDAARKDSWFSWIAGTLHLDSEAEGGILDLGSGATMRVALHQVDLGAPVIGDSLLAPTEAAADEPPPSEPEGFAFPLLRTVQSDPARSTHRFSVTQLLNYRRCPRQYYFDRLLHVPDKEALAFWNDAEAPEPPANLTATLRGSVIHRFCEVFEEGDEPTDRLGQSLDEVLRLRAADWGRRIVEIDREEAIRNLTPLADRYLNSDARKRIDQLRGPHRRDERLDPGSTHSGVFSECRFLIRRPLGTLTGSIDKLLLQPRPDGASLDAEIVDFKTNRLRGTITSLIEQTAADYLVQIQCYVLAVRELLPAVKKVRAVLHFLDPNIEYEFPADSISHEHSLQAVDSAMAGLLASRSHEEFPPRPADHCRRCAFLTHCREGRRWIHRPGTARF